MHKVLEYSHYQQLITACNEKNMKAKFIGTNLMHEDVERFIELERFYYEDLTNGLIFYFDADDFYQTFLYINTESALDLKALDKDICVYYFYNPKRSDKIDVIDEYFLNAGFKLNNVMKYFSLKKSTLDDSFNQRFQELKQKLESDDKYLCKPKESDLLKFETLYKKEINLFEVLFTTKKERTKQLEEGLLRCICDNGNNLYAINVDYSLGGGALAVGKNYQGNSYGEALLRYAVDEHFSKTNKKLSTWIASDNIVSLNLHKKVGFKIANKAYRRYVLSAEK